MNLIIIVVAIFVVVGLGAWAIRIYKPAGFVAYM